MKNETLKDKAYKYIKSKIINCEYAPGDFLDEKTLIKEINSSRTPIREALNKIEQENLIKIIPKKGVFVTEISLKNIYDVYQARNLIEPTTIIIYGNNYDKSKLTEFKSSFQKENLKSNDFYKIDDRFHEYIVNISKNSYIINLMNDIRVQNQRIRIITGKSHDFNNSINEHIEIIDSILNKNYTEAEQLMKKHIELATNRTLNVFSQK